METCDVLIAGAGPAGSVTAKLIADAGFKVILLERSEFDTFRPGESLSPAVKTLLHDLKLWALRRVTSLSFIRYAVCVG